MNNQPPNSMLIGGQLEASSGALLSCIPWRLTAASDKRGDEYHRPRDVIAGGRLATVVAQEAQRC